jgi:hypothetical protein
MKRISLAIIFAIVIPLFVLASKDPATHPLQVHILNTQWRGDGRGVYSGWGRGNIKDGGSIRGFDFTYFGCAPFKTTAGERQMYPGKWKKDPLLLEILVPEIGKIDKFSSCELKTTVSDGVYVHGAGGLISITQQEFKDWMARREAARAKQQGTPLNPNTTVPTSTPADQKGARVSIVSTPSGAEIEVDGSLMGSTPSSIDLLAGEHKVTIRKQGYKQWERNVKIASGMVNLNADLEKEVQK